MADSLRPRSTCLFVCLFVFKQAQTRSCKLRSQPAKCKYRFEQWTLNRIRFSQLLKQLQMQQDLNLWINNWVEAYFVQHIKPRDLNLSSKFKTCFKVPGSLVIVAKLVEKKWPPTLSFSIDEKWTCSSFFAISSNAFLSLRSLFVSRFRMSKASLMCLFTLSKASSPGKSFFELHFVDILTQLGGLYKRTGIKIKFFSWKSRDILCILRIYAFLWVSLS